MGRGAEISLSQLREKLPAELRQALEVLVRLADARRWPLFLVGGSLRDVLLGRPVLDLDLASEGDAAELARDGAALLGGEVRIHPPFLTASLFVPGGPRVDLVRTRRELYPSAGVLPEVYPASITEDLARRDFAVNAMALRICASGEMELLDPHGGREDLAGRRLRILHPASFRDDPTRALRGVRFELRLGFCFDSATAAALAEAVRAGCFAAVSGARLGAELALLAREPRGLDRGLARLAELGLLAVLHPGLRGSSETQASLAAASAHALLLPRASELAISPYRLLLLGLGLELGAGEQSELAARLEPRQEEAELLAQGAARVQRLLLSLTATTRPHAAARALELLSAEELARLAVEDGWPGIWARRFDRELRHVKVRLTGEDLKRDGVAPGPLLGEILREVRNARLDGRISAEDELRFAREVRERRAGSPQC